MGTTPTDGTGRPQIAFVGFGEAALAIAAGWKGNVSATVRAFDIKTDTVGPVRDAKLRDYLAAAVTGVDRLEDAIADADVIFSLVTADQAFAAASAVADGLKRPCLYFDGNSCAPDTKRRAAAVIDAAGGRYVDVAIMAAIHPKLHRTPVLVSGPHSETALDVMAALDMSATAAGGEVGTASAIKLCRSIMVKGLEALTAECLLTARSLGVDDAVLASLESSHPGFDWVNRAGKMLERMVVHGRRRAAEMSEAAKMVEDRGLQGGMSRATTAWQQRIGELAQEIDADAQADLAAALLDRLGRALTEHR